MSAGEPPLSSDVALYLKYNREVELGVWRKKEKSHGPAFIILFWFFFLPPPIPFFNPCDEVWTGRGMLSQTAISLHHMRLTHRMAGRRGVCREHSHEAGGRKRRHNMQSRMDCSRGSPILCSICLRRFGNAPHQRVYRCTNAPKETPSQITLDPFWNLNTCAVEQTSQVLTHKQPGTHTKWWCAVRCLAPPCAEDAVPTPWSCEWRVWKIADVCCCCLETSLLHPSARERCLSFAAGGQDRRTNRATIAGMHLLNIYVWDQLFELF